MMSLKTPRFWFDPQSLPSRLLSPLGCIYYAGARLRQTLTTPYKAGIPVICVGNLVAGGGGKTPVGLSIMSLIQNHKIANKPCFLTRGYGGRERGPLTVDLKSHSADMVGDEPLLLARTAPVILAANRRNGAQYAESKGFDLLVMDDGLQNPQLQKTLSLVVIDGYYGFGNGQLLPAGPLREPLAQGYAKADAFIMIGEDRHNLLPTLPGNKPVFRAKIAIPPAHKPDTRTPYVAFCGLAQPDKFRRTLADLGITMAGWHAYPDHHRYSQAELDTLAQTARQAQATLITTTKDAARLPEDFIKSNNVITLPIELKWDHEEQLVDFLKNHE